MNLKKLSHLLIAALAAAAAVQVAAETPAGKRLPATVNPEDTPTLKLWVFSLPAGSKLTPGEYREGRVGVAECTAAEVERYVAAAAREVGAIREYTRFADGTIIFAPVMTDDTEGCFFRVSDQFTPEFTQRLLEFEFFDNSSGLPSGPPRHLWNAETFCNHRAAEEHTGTIYVRSSRSGLTVLAAAFD
jgi:hypothetical protein